MSPLRARWTGVRAQIRIGESCSDEPETPVPRKCAPKLDTFPVITIAKLADGLLASLGTTISNVCVTALRFCPRGKRRRGSVTTLPPGLVTRRRLCTNPARAASWARPVPLGSWGLVALRQINASSPSRRCQPRHFNRECRLQHQVNPGPFINRLSGLHDVVFIISSIILVMNSFSAIIKV